MKPRSITLHLPALIGAVKPRRDRGEQPRRRAMLLELCRLTGGRCLNEVAGLEYRRGLGPRTRIYFLLGSPLELWEQVRWTWRGYRHTFWIQAHAPHPSTSSLVPCPTPQPSTAPLACADSSIGSTRSTTASPRG